MGRQSRECRSVLTTRVATLDAAGFGLAQAGPDDDCPVCGCAMGEHDAVLPGDTTLATIAERSGWIECDWHDTTCGTWGIVRPAA